MFFEEFKTFFDFSTYFSEAKCDEGVFNLLALNHDEHLQNCTQLYSQHDVTNKYRPNMEHRQAIKKCYLSEIDENQTNSSHLTPTKWEQNQGNHNNLEMKLTISNTNSNSKALLLSSKNHLKTISKLQHSKNQPLTNPLKTLKANILKLRGYRGKNRPLPELKHIDINDSLRYIAAEVIHDFWKRYLFRKIFCYLRDQVHFYNVSSPSSILRLVNPLEANLLDAASGGYVRFRLCGATFPPQIVYKIFTKRPVVVLGYVDTDVNINKSRRGWKSTEFERSESISTPLCQRIGKPSTQRSINKKYTKNISTENNDWRHYCETHFGSAFSTQYIKKSEQNNFLGACIGMNKNSKSKQIAGSPRQMCNRQIGTSQRLHDGPHLSVKNKSKHSSISQEVDLLLFTEETEHLLHWANNACLEESIPVKS